MATTLTANSNTLVKTVNAPQDGVDNVEQSSVNPAFQGILNNTYAIARREVYTRPQLSMQCLNGTQITVQSFNGLWASKTTPVEDYFPLSKDSPVTLTSADVEGGGGFVANTIYYIYAFYDAGSTNQTKLQLSADPLFPDETLTWKRVGGVNQLTHRYIGSCICYDNGGTPNILPFQMQDLDYTFAAQWRTNYSVTPLTSNTDVDITLTNIPKYARVAKIRCIGKNNTANFEDFYIYSKDFTAIGVTFQLYKNITDFYQHEYLELPLGPTTQRLRGAVPGGGANVAVYVNYTGYKE